VPAVLLALVSAGCTDDSPPAARPSPSASVSTAKPPPRSAPLQVTVARVDGRLPAATRKRVVAAVRRTLGDYVDAAFLRADHPGAVSTATFRTFVPGIRDRAHHDARMLSNAPYASTTESVRALRRTAKLFVLAPKRVAAGVTARVNLLFRVERGDRPARRVHLTGLLMMTHRETGWSVFGYRVARSDDPVRRGS
jgi:hypothetical protein